MRRNWAWMLVLALGLGLVGSVYRPRGQVADSAASLEDSPKLIALTFDDGPKPATTAALLDGLSQRGVQATFFLIGNQVPGNEGLVRRMEAEGHQVGVHTFDHKPLTGLNEGDFRGQVEQTRALLTEILGHGDFMLRPPYGQLDAGVKRWADSPIILWSVDPEDWRDKDSRRVVRHILDHAQDGDIVLMHDIFPSSVEAALQVIDQLHAEGFHFVTVEALLAAKGVSPQAGRAYRSGRPS